MAQTYLPRYVAVEITLKKTIDRSARQDITNALAVLEHHGLVAHSNFFTQAGDKDVWAYVTEAKNIRITQVDKTTYEMEVITLG